MTKFIVSIPTGYAHLPSDRLGATRSLTSTAMGAATYVEEALRWIPAQEKESEGATELERIFPQSLAPLISDSLTPTRILLADDNADMRDYVKRLLSQSYKVQAVPNGVAALAENRRTAQYQPLVALRAEGSKS